jgi:hypothetical protein
MDKVIAQQALLRAIEARDITSTIMCLRRLIPPLPKRDVEVIQDDSGVETAELWYQLAARVNEENFHDALMCALVIWTRVRAQYN